MKVWTFDLLLQHSGLTQNDLAAKLGVSPAAVCRWLKGERLPKRSQLQKIFSFFNHAEQVKVSGVIFGNPYYKGESK